MFLWPIALQYFIYTICILLIDYQIVHKSLFLIVTCLNAILLSVLYPLFGIFSTLIAIFMLAMIFHCLSSSHRPLVYALTLGLLSSLLGDHLASIGDFIVFGSPVIEPGDSSQYFHIALSALLSFILAYSFRKSLDNWSYVIDYQIIGTIGVFILSTYYIIILYTRFSGGNPEVLALNTTFFILYLCIGLIIFIYYWKISNAKMEEQLLEQRIQLQQDYIRDIEKNYQELREFKHDYQNLLFSMNSYIIEEDLEGLQKYYDQNILPTREIMNLTPVNLSLLDKINVPEIRSLLSLKLMMAIEKSISLQITIPEEVKIDSKHTVNLVRILGIVLDNATEGAAVTKKKKIELLILKKKNSLVIRVVNTTINTLPLNQLKQKGFSTKSNPKNEGLGLHILDNLAKTNPYLLIETSIENQRFSQTIYIQTH
ncbi:MULTISPECIES: GHKL domain-containing protein [Enterococcus]|uniref:Accessory gene regulator C n=1 Tax=Enterococcus mundtii TaxID=53346 RepID=A0A2M9FS49_ENTMU|nr:GHKL domain-containing protein [Enterococcus mundtii]MBE9911768.1 GHKL domain-containing protein [Enterococcus mundtii]MCA6773483.1 GHKL domain-containing protein [Enterococcus mundtii]MRI73301.1 GHKL domain-containing protein [Enterococcus mundtii]NMP57185.1 GHKL domain-containing protein [Enterococcus mundtii]PJK26273.1 GHKL domain-containing protein [Enterococcus mundtii]